jgi:hypothetical protein
VPVIKRVGGGIAAFGGYAAKTQQAGQIVCCTQARITATPVGIAVHNFSTRKIIEDAHADGDLCGTSRDDDQKQLLFDGGTALCSIMQNTGVPM